MDMIGLICPGKNVVRVEAPTRFCALAVPEAIVDRNGWIKGDPLVRQLFAQFKTTISNRKIYVSRSRLTKSTGLLIMEELIEQNLEANGYLIVHPQLMSLYEQLTLYASSSHLIFAEGSAMHLYSLVCNPGQKAYAIWRRGVKPVFIQQINSFGGSRLHGVDCRRATWLLKASEQKSEVMATEIDLVRLYHDLCRHKFISANPWRFPAEDDLLSELEKTSQAYKNCQWEKALP